MKALHCLSALLFAGCTFLAHAADEDIPELTVQKGAEVYRARCVLCHGNEGMGDGPLAVTIKNYPETSLIPPRFAKDPILTRHIVVYGGMPENGMSSLMPPWGSELSWAEVESLVLFLDVLRIDVEKARKLLAITASKQQPSRNIGRQIFRSRCAQCHGVEGRGDGRLSRMIKNPPPFNLTYSAAPDDYLFKIIQGGGQSMGRSPQMPPWGGELTDTDIHSVIVYIKEFRGHY